MMYNLLFQRYLPARIKYGFENFHAVIKCGLQSSQSFNSLPNNFSFITLLPPEKVC